ncbi:MAG TPA: SdiA-regulated domain-containing protein [Patescibacteria group bacterium]|nr:SdiA-regulated domain-containing protein [Patescibacteria group bacterium]
MRNRFSIFYLVLGILFVPASAFGANLTWPGTGSVTIPLSAPYEPSGLAWNSRTNKLFSVSDPTSDGKNRVTMMDRNGSNQIEWRGGGDYEALTIIDPNSSYIYIGVENAPAILEFDWSAPPSTPRITKSWSLNNWLPGMGNAGLEGLAFVPNEFHDFADSSSGGVFYVGVQREYNLTDTVSTNNSSLYVFNVNKDLSGQVSLVGEITMDPSLPKKDVSDLFFNLDTGTLFVLYDDSINLLVEMKPDGTVLNKYTNVPGSAREGFVLIPNETNTRKNAYVAHDNTSAITWHSNFTQTYFQDLDGDGFGSNITTTSISLIPPTGYVANYLDSKRPQADYDFDNDGLITSLDCDDHNVALLDTQIFYQDQDGDGLGAGAAVELCALQAGFVANNSDVNDRDFDNDGVETALDCDDHNNTILGKQNFYRDLDHDGLGSKTAFVNACFNPDPTTYISNNLDFDDSIRTNGIELTGDLIDNDGDNIIDEVNTVPLNGYHKYLRYFNPRRAGLANRYLVSITPLNNGRIRIMYSDHAVYSYLVYPNYSGPMLAERYNGTAVIKIKKTAGATSAYYMNAYTGWRIWNPN